MKSWHQFLDTVDGVSECTTCLVEVSNEALNTFTLPCPAGDCMSPSNPDGPCVFYPRRSEASCCIYCGRPGIKVRAEDATEATPVGALMVAPAGADPADVEQWTQVGHLTELIRLT